MKQLAVSQLLLTCRLLNNAFFLSSCRHIVYKLEDSVWHYSLRYLRARFQANTALAMPMTAPFAAKSIWVPVIFFTGLRLFYGRSLGVACSESSYGFYTWCFVHIVYIVAAVFMTIFSVSLCFIWWKFLGSAYAYFSYACLYSEFLFERQNSFEFPEV